MIQTTPLTLTDVAPDVVRCTLERAVSSAFEHLVFLELQRVSDDVALEADQIHAQLLVASPLACLILLQMSSALVDACVDALYCGTMCDSTVRQDVVNELTNTIAGLMMSQLSDDSKIELGLPQGGAGTPRINAGYGITSAFATDFGRLRLTVVLGV